MGTDSAVAGAISSKHVSANVARLRIFLLLFGSCLLMIAVSAIAVFATNHYWENAFRAEVERSLTQKAQMLASQINSDRSRKIADIAAQEGQHAGARATVIDESGRVLADSEIPVKQLEDEGHRPEFIAALRGGTGAEVRQGSRFGIDVLYVAVPVSGGAVRLSYPLADTGVGSSRAKALVVATALELIIALLTSWFIAPMVRRGYASNPNSA